MKKFIKGLLNISKLTRLHKCINTFNISHGPYESIILQYKVKHIFFLEKKSSNDEKTVAIKNSYLTINNETLGKESKKRKTIPKTVREQVWKTYIN
jgi:hypothetical protein